MTVTDQIDRARRNFNAAYPSLQPFAVAMHPTELEQLHSSKVAKHRIRRAPEASAAAIAYADLVILIYQDRVSMAGPVVMSKAGMQKLLALELVAWG